MRVCEADLRCPRDIHEDARATLDAHSALVKHHVEPRHSVSIDDATYCFRIRGNPQAGLQTRTQSEPFCVDPLYRSMMPSLSGGGQGRSPLRLLTWT